MKISQYLVLTILFIGFPQTPAYAAQGDQLAVEGSPLTMVIFPRRNVKLTHRMFRPMADYLSRALDRKVQLKTPKDFQSFWEVLDKGEFDLVHLNQYHYIVSSDKHGYQAILKNVEFGSPTMRGVIMVRTDSGIESVEDLRGKKILFGGGPRAMQSYIIPTWLLHNAGLKKGDYQEVFAKNPPNALIATYHRQADAAGVGNVVARLNVVKNSINVEKLKTLLEGPALPQLVWAVKKTMPDNLKQRIQEKLSQLVTHPAGQEVLDKAQLTGLLVAEDHEYDLYRSIVANILGNAGDRIK